MGATSSVPRRGTSSSRPTTSANRSRIDLKSRSNEVGAPAALNGPPSAAIRTKDSYLRAQFHRLKSRLGPMKAIIAVAASMLTSAFHMLTNGSEYKELTGAHFDRRDHAKLAKRLVRRLEDIGLKVTVEQAA